MSQEFERYPALASWIERLGNTAGLALGEWMVFVGSLNHALSEARQEGARGGEPVAWRILDQFGTALALCALKPGELIVGETLQPLYASPAEPSGSSSVKMPETADEAAMMCLLGEAWLKEHAPERLREPSGWRADRAFSLLALAEVATKAAYTHGFGFREVVGPYETNGKVYVNFAWDDDRLVRAIFFMSPDEEPLPPTSEGGGA